MNSMFEVLMGLPLFRGATRERMAETVGMAKFHFLKYLPGETVVEAGAPCTHIKFIISGCVRSKIVNPDSRFKVSQTLYAPDVIAADYLFGRATNYPCTVTALEPTGILQIAKSDYLKILNSDEVFMFNYLNLLSMNAQKSVSGVLALTTGSIEERIAFWIVALTQPTGKDIALECRQRDLYSFFGVPRGSFIATLDSMKERGLLTYSPNKIDIVDRRTLINLLEAKLNDSSAHGDD